MCMETLFNFGRFLIACVSTGVPTGPLAKTSHLRGKSRSTTPAPAATCSSNRKFLRGPCLSHEPERHQTQQAPPSSSRGKEGEHATRRACCQPAALPLAVRAPRLTLRARLPPASEPRRWTARTRGAGRPPAPDALIVKIYLFAGMELDGWKDFRLCDHDAFATTSILSETVCCHRPPRRSQRPLLPSSGQLQARCQRMWYSGSIGRIWSK